MSYEEVQFEEKAVQLIPEDFDILSEYAWDMTGYPSRFGFFYLGNVNLNGRNLHRLDRIEKCDACMGIGTGIDYDSVYFSICFLDFIHKISLMVGLTAYGLDLTSLRMLPNQLQKRLIALRTVQRRLADPKHIEVGPVQNI